MKAELKIIALLVWWLVLLGLVGPFLISAESTIAVVAGFILIGVTAYGTYRYARTLVPSKKED